MSLKTVVDNGNRPAPVGTAFMPSASIINGDNIPTTIAMREMFSNDIDDVLEIERVSFSDYWSRQAFEECLIFNENFVVYIIDTMELVGYFIGSGVLDEYQIYNLAVKSSYQRKGLASYMLSTLFAFHAKKYLKYFLEVRPSNTNAISLYEKFGFIQIHVRKQYYHNPREDAVVMCLKV